MNSTNKTTATAGSSAKVTTKPTTAPSTAFVDFGLAQFHCAALRSKIITNQIETAATALSAGMISPEAALLILYETGDMTYEKHFDDLVEGFVRERQAATRREAAQTLRAAETTFQAVAYVLREHGMRRLNDPWLTIRLAGFSDTQIAELITALERGQPRYPAITSELISQITKLRDDQ